MARARQVVMLDPEVRRLLRVTCRESHVNLSDFVQAAVVNRLKSWEAPAAFIANRRAAQERTPAKILPDSCDKLGFPKAYKVEQPLAEIARALAENGEQAVCELMQRWWTLAAIAEPYGDAQLQATLREYERRNSKRSKQPEPAVANPPGFGQWPSE
jgi:hypothetical protein